MLAPSLYSVKFGLRAANGRLFNIIQERLFEKKCTRTIGQKRERRLNLG